MTVHPDVEWIHGLNPDEARGALAWLSRAYPDEFRQVRRIVEDARRRRAERAEFRRSLRDDAYPAPERAADA